MYTIEHFKKNYGVSDLINQDVINTLNKLVKDLNFKDVLDMKKGNFLLENTKKKGLNNADDWDRIRRFQKTELIKNDGIENDIQKFRKQLNILTDKSFSKVENEMINLITNVKEKHPERFDFFSREIYNLISNNLLYSNLYSKLYCSIEDNFDNFKKIVDSEFINFDKLFDDIKYCSPDDDYDIFCDNNKNNEKRRGVCHFFTNLMVMEKIDKYLLIDKLNILYDKLISDFSVENKKNQVDEMAELIYIIISNSYKFINEDSLEYLIEKIKMVSMLKIKDYKSLTNKCLFKHMDLLDEIV